MTSRVWTLGLVTLLAACGSTCQKPSETGDTPDAAKSASAKPVVTLEGVDTTQLTGREKATWSEYVTELLAPCPEVAVPLAQCVQDKRECSQCVPAAQFLARLVQAGRPKKEALSVFDARFHPKKVKTVVIGGSAVKGPSNAEVTLVEFADFECPACGMAYPLVEKMYDKYKANMRVVFKHFPLESHPNAKLAAQAAFAGQKQGNFWGMHGLMFQNQQRLTEPDLLGYAKELSLDVERFKTDMLSDAAKERVEQEKQQGIGLGVQATPTLLINGRDCDLTMLPDPVGDLDNWIGLEIKLVKERRAKAAGGTAKSASPDGSAAPEGSAAPDSSAASEGSAATAGSATKAAPKASAQP